MRTSAFECTPVGLSPKKNPLADARGSVLSFTQTIDSATDWLPLFLREPERALKIAQQIFPVFNAD
jgi:hypothetical protein